MNDMMLQSRINQILAQKAMMGAGDYGGVAMGGYRRRRRRAPIRRRRRAYGRGEYDDMGEGVLVGGYRRRRRRAPVRRRRARRSYGYGGDDGGDYGGVVIGGYRRKRRPSAWNLAVGDYVRKHPGMTVAEAAHALSGRRGYRTKRRGAGLSSYAGGARASRSYLPKAEILKAQKDEDEFYRSLACDRAAIKSRVQRGKMSNAEFKRMIRECRLDPLTRARKGLDLELRALARKGIKEYKPDELSADNYYSTLFQ